MSSMITPPQSPCEKGRYSPLISSPLNPSTSCCEVPSSPYSHTSHRSTPRTPSKPIRRPSSLASPTQRLLRQKAEEAFKAETLRRQVHLETLTKSLTSISPFEDQHKGDHREGEIELQAFSSDVPLDEKPLVIDKIPAPVSPRKSIFLENLEDESGDIGLTSTETEQPFGRREHRLIQPYRDFAPESYRDGSQVGYCPPSTENGAVAFPLRKRSGITFRRLVFAAAILCGLGFVHSLLRGLSERPTVGSLG